MRPPESENCDSPLIGTATVLATPAATTAVSEQAGGTTLADGETSTIAWSPEFQINVQPGVHSSRRLDVDYHLSDDKHKDAFYVAQNVRHKLNSAFKTGEAEVGGIKVSVVSIEELLLISDGGPNHYKTRLNWYQMSLLPAQYYNKDADSNLQPLKVSQAVRGEHHGKGLVDAFNATGKAPMRRKEKHRTHDEEAMQTSHIDCAKDAVRVGNQDTEKRNLKKGEGQGNVPFRPRRGRNYIAESITYHETDSKELERMRVVFGDCDVLEGTHTHFQFNFVREGTVDMRFLTCVCHSCRREYNPANCSNIAYVGMLMRGEMSRKGAVGDNRALRRQLAHAIADELTGHEDAVAVFTQLGEVRGERMWLLKPKGKPYVLTQRFKCTVSGEEFDAGERVLQGWYYARLGSREELYEYKPHLGLFTVPASMLRAGGKEIPIKLTEYQHNAHYLEVDAHTRAAISNIMDTTFRDRE